MEYFARKRPTAPFFPGISKIFRFYGIKIIDKHCVKLQASGYYIKATNFFLSQMALLDNGKLSDFTIVVNDVKIPVHKAMLSARSPVFEAMFSHNNTKEAQEHKMEVTDVSPIVMKDFLQFIYTGVKPKCCRLSIELLALADKVNWFLFIFVL